MGVSASDLDHYTNPPPAIQVVKTANKTVAQPLAPVTNTCGHRSRNHVHSSPERSRPRRAWVA